MFSYMKAGMHNEMTKAKTRPDKCKDLLADQWLVTDNLNLGPRASKLGALRALPFQVFSYMKVAVFIYECDHNHI